MLVLMLQFMYIYKTTKTPYQSIPSQKQTRLAFQNCAGDNCTNVFDDEKL